MGAATELWAKRRDGTEFPVEISLSFLATDEGPLVAAAIRDVTAVRRGEERFRGLLSSAPDAIIGVDSDGRIELMNEQAARLFGWDHDELIGRPVEVLVPLAVQERHVAHRRSYLADPVARPMGLGLRLQARRRDGSEFPAEISLSTIEGDDGGTTVLAAVRDVTERLELEKERQRQALEVQREQTHRLESIGQLAGGIAHDFNNLLGVILNYSTLAARSTDDPALRDDLDQISEAAQRAADLTRQLLTFARRDPARPELVDIGALVTRFAHLLSRTLGERISLSVDVCTEPALAVVDGRQVEQVLLNLCLNARDAMPEGGALQLVCSVDDLAEGPTPSSDPGRYVLLRVIDEGAGMDAETLDRAFEPFFTTKGPGDGTGLGLASVYGIVQQNGGMVQLSSTLGVGTTAEVLLPAVDVDDQGSTVAPPAPARAVVLLVEDEASLRRVVARMLSDAGHEVVQAPDAKAALKLVAAQERSVDLVLTDVVMPGLSGPMLMEELAAQEGIQPPVVFMSGYAPAGQGIEGRRILAKPFTERALLDAVREALDG
jgi:PAS domain S-box-containing protein